MLESAPSFSIYNTSEAEELTSLMTDGDEIDGSGSGSGSGDFSFVKKNMDLIKEEEEGGDDEVVVQPVSPPLCLATGIGVTDHGVEGFRLERENSEEYMELLQEFPNHPLVLRNYAQFLQRKGDLEEAEYYYLRTIQADPSDGEIMSQYAKLVWDLHRDQEKALTYFELATKTASDDSNVLAAYAKFLWEIDDDEQDESEHHDQVQGNEISTIGLDAGDTYPISGAGDPTENADIEKYYKGMIEENPSDPLLLKTYAQFLYQSKGDLHGAEEYYLRATLAYPQDGELLSQYAKLVWELYHDQDRALPYFERAIVAAPGDSNVLAAYASFLWAIDDDDVLDKQLDSISQTVLAGA